MTNSQAKSELMQIYMSLSEEKKQALDVLMAQADGEYISRQAVLDLLEDTNNGWIINEVSQLPSVKPQEKTGHWVKTPKAVMGEGYMWYCDKCEHQVYQDSSKSYPSEKYCPNCGCRMVEPQESEEV